MIGLWARLAAQARRPTGQSLGFSKMAGPDAAETLETSGGFSSKIRSGLIDACRTVSTGIDLEPAGSLSRSASGLTLDETRVMIQAVADAIIESEPILTEADRALGDGDHGVGMRRGFRAMITAIDAADPDDFSKLFAVAGNALLTTMGGASGVVFGSLFLAGGKTLPGATHFGTHEIERLPEQGSARPTQGRTTGREPTESQWQKAVIVSASASSGPQRRGHSIASNARTSFLRSVPAEAERLPWEDVAVTKSVRSPHYDRKGEVS